MANQSSIVIMISQLKRGNMPLYEKAVQKIFGEQLSWKKVQEASSYDHYRLYDALKEEIELMQSPLDVRKTGYMIQCSRSGFGRSAFTPFECKFCGKMEMWINTAVPHICEECAINIAKELARNAHKLIKQDVMNN